MIALHAMGLWDRITNLLRRLHDDAEITAIHSRIIGLLELEDEIRSEIMSLRVALFSGPKAFIGDTQTQIQRRGEELDRIRAEVLNLRIKLTRMESK